MKKWVISNLLLLVASNLWATVVGQWHLYQPQNNITEVEEVAPDSLYFVLTPPSLYLTDITTGRSTTYDRLSGLNGISVSHIAWNDSVQRLLIAYNTNEIDILSLDGTVTYIPELYNTLISGDKTIKGTVVKDQYVYVNTPLTILCIDMSAQMVTRSIEPDSEEGKWVKRQPQARTDKSALPEAVDNPDHPVYKQFHYALFSDRQLYTVPGAYRSVRGWEGNRPGAVQVMDTDTHTWHLFDNSFKDTLSHKYVDLEQLTVDPTDAQHIVASGRTGIYEFRADTLFRHFSYYNAPLQDAAGTKGNYVIVDGILFDPEGNLWFTNSIADGKQLHCLTKEGEWVTPSFMEEEGYCSLSSLMIDSRGYLWFINEEIPDPLLVCYDYKNNGVQTFTRFVNQNGDSFNDNQFRFQCLTEDAEGNIWIGSTKGPFYIKAEQIYSGQQVFNQYIVPRNDGSGLGDYLLNGVHIYHMAVDASGRKWFATNGNGVYLVSADNNEMLQHFTTDNSPLPSDNVFFIAIDPESGEVYFCTDEGLASWQSDVTPGAKDYNSLYCYPNPVRADYSGSLTICGLMAGSTVTVTDAANRQVYRTETLSGTVLWDLTTNSGNRVKPGVYNIYGIDEEGKKGAKCKILVF